MKPSKGDDTFRDSTDHSEKNTSAHNILSTEINGATSALPSKSKRLVPEGPITGKASQISKLSADPVWCEPLSSDSSHRPRSPLNGIYDTGNGVHGPDIDIIRSLSPLGTAASDGPFMAFHPGDGRHQTTNGHMSPTPLISLISDTNDVNNNNREMENGIYNSQDALAETSRCAAELVKRAFDNISATFNERLQHLSNSPDIWAYDDIVSRSKTPRIDSPDDKQLSTLKGDRTSSRRPIPFKSRYKDDLPKDSSCRNSIRSRLEEIHLQWKERANEIREEFAILQRRQLEDYMARKYRHIMSSDEIANRINIIIERRWKRAMVMENVKIRRIENERLNIRRKIISLNRRRGIEITEEEIEDQIKEFERRGLLEKTRTMNVFFSDGNSTPYSEQLMSTSTRRGTPLHLPLSPYSEYSGERLGSQGTSSQKRNSSSVYMKTETNFPRRILSVNNILSPSPHSTEYEMTRTEKRNSDTGAFLSITSWANYANQSATLGNNAGKLIPTILRNQPSTPDICSLENRRSLSPSPTELLTNIGSKSPFHNPNHFIETAPTSTTDTTISTPVFTSRTLQYTTPAAGPPGDIRRELKRSLSIDSNKSIRKYKMYRIMNEEINNSGLVAIGVSIKGLDSLHSGIDSTKNNRMKNSISNSISRNVRSVSCREVPFISASQQSKSPLDAKIQDVCSGSIVPIPSAPRQIIPPNDVQCSEEHKEKIDPRPIQDSTNVHNVQNDQQETKSNSQLLCGHTRTRTLEVTEPSTTPLTQRNIPNLPTHSIMNQNLLPSCQSNQTNLPQLPTSSSSVVQTFFSQLLPAVARIIIGNEVSNGNSAPNNGDIAEYECILLRNYNIICRNEGTEGEKWVRDQLKTIAANPKYNKKVEDNNYIGMKHMSLGVLLSPEVRKGNTTVQSANILKTSADDGERCTLKPPVDSSNIDRLFMNSTYGEDNHLVNNPYKTPRNETPTLTPQNTRPIHSSTDSISERLAYVSGNVMPKYTKYLTPKRPHTAHMHLQTKHKDTRVSSGVSSNRTQRVNTNAISGISDVTSKSVQSWFLRTVLPVNDGNVVIANNISMKGEEDPRHIPIAAHHRDEDLISSYIAQYQHKILKEHYRQGKPQSIIRPESDRGVCSGKMTGTLLQWLLFLITRYGDEDINRHDSLSCIEYLSIPLIVTSTVLDAILVAFNDGIGDVGVAIESLLKQNVKENPEFWLGIAILEFLKGRVYPSPSGREEYGHEVLFSSLRTLEIQIYVEFSEESENIRNQSVFNNKQRHEIVELVKDFLSEGVEIAAQNNRNLLEARVMLLSHLCDTNDVNIIEKHNDIHNTTVCTPNFGRNKAQIIYSSICASVCNRGFVFLFQEKEPLLKLLLDCQDQETRRPNKWLEQDFLWTINNVLLAKDGRVDNYEGASGKEKEINFALACVNKAEIRDPLKLSNIRIGSIFNDECASLLLPYFKALDVSHMRELVDILITRYLGVVAVQEDFMDALVNHESFKVLHLLQGSFPTNQVSRNDDEIAIQDLPSYDEPIPRSVLLVCRDRADSASPRDHTITKTAEEPTATLIKLSKSLNLFEHVPVSYNRTLLGRLREVASTSGSVPLASHEWTSILKCIADCIIPFELGGSVNTNGNPTTSSFVLRFENYLAVLKQPLYERLQYLIIATVEAVLSNKFIKCDRDGGIISRELPLTRHTFPPYSDFILSILFDIHRQQHQYAMELLRRNDPKDQIKREHVHSINNFNSKDIQTILKHSAHIRCFREQDTCQAGLLGTLRGDRHPIDNSRTHAAVPHVEVSATVPPPSIYRINRPCRVLGGSISWNAPETSDHNTNAPVRPSFNDVIDFILTFSQVSTRDFCTNVHTSMIPSKQNDNNNANSTVPWLTFEQLCRGMGLSSDAPETQISNVREHFDRLDSDKDGKLTVGEFMAFIGI